MSAISIWKKVHQHQPVMKADSNLVSSVSIVFHPVLGIAAQCGQQEQDGFALWGKLGTTVPDQGQGGNVIVDGGLAHELLHAINHGGAQFLGCLFAGLL
jgi:hypothetical protein